MDTSDVALKGDVNGGLRIVLHTDHPINKSAVYRMQKHTQYTCTYNQFAIATYDGTGLSNMIRRSFCWYGFLHINPYVYFYGTLILRLLQGVHTIVMNVYHWDLPRWMFYLGY